MTGNPAPILSRRRVSVFALAVLLAGCSDPGPEDADAVDQITQHLRKQLENSGQTVNNVTFKSGRRSGEQYIVLVDYELLTVIAGIGTFSGQTRRGDVAPVENEQYVFVRTNKGWRLDE